MLVAAHSSETPYKHVTLCHKQTWKTAHNKPH